MALQLVELQSMATHPIATPFNITKDNGCRFNLRVPNLENLVTQYLVLAIGFGGGSAR